MIVQAIYQGYTKKGQKPPSIDKIMPKWGGDDEAVDDSPEAQRARFTRAIAAAAPKEKRDKRPEHTDGKAGG